MPTEKLERLSVDEIVEKCLNRDFEVTGDKRDYLAYAFLKEVHEVNQRMKILTKNAEIPYEKTVRDAENALKKAEAEKENAKKEEALKKQKAEKEKIKAENDAKSAKMSAEFDRQQTLKDVQRITKKTSRIFLESIAIKLGIDNPGSEKDYPNKKTLTAKINEIAKGL